MAMSKSKSEPKNTTDTTGVSVSLTAEERKQASVQRAAERKQRQAESAAAKAATKQAELASAGEGCVQLAAYKKNETQISKDNQPLLNLLDFFCQNGNTTRGDTRLDSAQASAFGRFQAELQKFRTRNGLQVIAAPLDEFGEARQIAPRFKRSEMSLTDFFQSELSLSYRCSKLE